MGKSKFGPGFLVAAAFVGPGTVTTATLAGAKFGFSLIWVVVIAIISAIVLQEMVGRFSLSSGFDIASAIVKVPERNWVKTAFQILTFSAVVIGCAAYEAGNIVGGSNGINIVFGFSVKIWAVIISILAILLLIIGKYKIIERLLITLVVIMGVCFLVTAILVKPDLSRMLKGLSPKIPPNSLPLILALIGTTVVPYNLFLHSSIVLKKWKTKKDIRFMRMDIILSIGLGGLITIAMIVTSQSAYFINNMNPQELAGISAEVKTIIKKPVDLSDQLKPFFGSFAQICFGIGYFAAGLSSAITAPYAAAWTAKGIFGWKEKDYRFTMVFTGIILSGIAVSILSLEPLSLIVFAQIANAVLLPLIIGFLFILLNSKKLLEYKNKLWQNLIFVIIFIIILLINLKYFLK